MAASKDVFEPHVFASNVFAAGAFRGLGDDVVDPPEPFHAGGKLSVAPRFGGKVEVKPQFAGKVNANQ